MGAGDEDEGGSSGGVVETEVGVLAFSADTGDLAAGGVDEGEALGLDDEVVIEVEMDVAALGESLAGPVAGV